MNIMDIYNKLPITLQNMACSIEGKRIQMNRYNSKFFKTLKEYQARNDWSYEEKCEYRDRKLQEMIIYSYNSVPYYKKLFDEYGINPKQIKTLDDLNIIPILTKADIKANFNDLISTEFDKKKMIKASTSGTTGSGLNFYTTEETLHEQWATFWRARYNIGLEYGTKGATFGGRNVVPIEQKKPPFWRYNKPGNQIYFSVYHINEENFYTYIKELEDKKIEWIHTYPSAISLIAKYMIDNRIKIKSKIKYITTGSENLMDSQKELIIEAFGVTPYQHYGQAENVAIFSEDKNHNMYVDEDFSAVEFILDKELQVNKVVGTSLTNKAMPLIRYEIGDVADFSETKDGRKIVSIDGRKDDYIILRDGTKIGRLAHILNGVSNITESQIVQKKEGITIKVVKGIYYSEKDENKLISNLQKRIGYSEDINIEYVDEIAKTKNGKLRFVISEMD